jgi:phospholipid-transporting ATPase
VAIQLSLCALSALINMIYTIKYSESYTYMYYDYSMSNLKLFFVSFFQWFILLQNFVSISLLVTLEMVKLFQAYFIEQDWMMLDMGKDMEAKVNSSNLNEELGMISYVFSDKTGTLT